MDAQGDERPARVAVVDREDGAEDAGHACGEGAVQRLVGELVAGEDQGVAGAAHGHQARARVAASTGTDVDADDVADPVVHHGMGPVPRGGQQQLALDEPGFQTSGMLQQRDEGVGSKWWPDRSPHSAPTPPVSVVP